MSSGSENESGSGDDRGKLDDMAWVHCWLPYFDKSGITKCNYYLKITYNGMITRLQYHIVGGEPNVKKCSKTQLE